MSAPLVVVDNLAEVGTLSSSSASTYRPLANLAVRDGSRPFQFAAAAADDYVHLDLNDPSLDGFEGATLLWTDTSAGASNTAALATDQKNAGAKSMKLHYATAGATAYARGQFDITNVPAGQRRNLNCALRGDATLTVHLYAFIPECGLYLDPATQTWTATPTDFASRSAATWATTAAVTFVMPTRVTYPVCRRRRMTLRLVAYVQHASSTGDAWVDDVYCWPSVDFVGFHSHDLGSVSVVWQTSDDAWSASATKATLTVAERRFFTRATTPADNRYQGVLFSGTNHEAAWMGKLCFGQALTLQESLGWGHDVARDWPQARNGSSAVALSGVRQDTYTLPIEWTTSDAHAEFAYEAWGLCRGGVDPCWFVPLDDEADVLYCNFARVLQDRRTFIARWQTTGLELVEQPHVRWNRPV